MIAFGTTEVITRDSFRREKDFQRWDETAKLNKYPNVTHFFLKEYFAGNNSALTLSEELHASRLTVVEKLRLFEMPLKKSEIIKSSGRKRKKVHWVFECGCEYKGKRYTPRLCKKHKERLSHEFISCITCGVTIKCGPKKFSMQYCPKCKNISEAQSRKTSRKKAAKKTKRVPVKNQCTREGCKRRRKPGHRFLCDMCFKKFSE